MREFKEIAAWLAEGTPHTLDYVETLPGPSFRANGRPQLSFSSNNYLALSASPRLTAAAHDGIKRYGVANCESRLLGGNLEIYDALECKIAKLKHKESAVLFATGYLTNLGVLSSLPRTGQYARIYGYRAKGTHSYAYFSDEFNHISIREGIRNSGADRHTFRHGDLDHLESLLKKSTADSRIIVTDGVFSQDGDIADLPGLLALAELYDAMVYVDDAHGTGVLGRNGEGTSEFLGVKSPRLIQMGTLSKAYGAIGGFIATDAAIAEVLRLSCAAYGFTSTLPPDQALAVSEAIDAVADEPQRRQRLWDNQRYFLARMAHLPYKLVSAATPIVPIMIGNEALADTYAGLLRDEGMHVDSVKFPAVPMGKARLRIQLNAGHSWKQIDNLVEVLDANQHLVGGSKPRRDKLAPALASFRPFAERPWAIAAFAKLDRAKGAAMKWLPRLPGLRDVANPEFNVALNLVTLATAALVAVDLYLDIPHLIFLYLLPVLFVAKKFGRNHALLASALSAIGAAFFLYEPDLNWSGNDGQDANELIAFSLIALAICFAFGKASSPLKLDRS
jgi:8-amino-7-oxononanoate synthase